MRSIQGESREQLMFLPASLDDYIATDNETRSIDLFVNSLNLQEYGFKMKKGDDGRPAYHPSVLLKLFICRILNIMAWEEFGKYMKALARDLKRAVLSMIHAFEIITSGFLSLHRNVLFCNGLRKGSGYLNKLGEKVGF